MEANIWPGKRQNVTEPLRQQNVITTCRTCGVLSGLSKQSNLNAPVFGVVVVVAVVAMLLRTGSVGFACNEIVG